MAKVGSPLPPEQIPFAVPNWLQHQATIYGHRVIWPTHQIALTPAQTAARNAIFEAIRLKYHSLHPWKRTRWTICAMRHGVHNQQPAGHRGWSGLGLYIWSYLAQATLPHQQPISPCARRTWDPLANPYDWTP